MSEKTRVDKSPGEQRGIATDIITSVVSGAAGGVAGVAAQQALDAVKPKKGSKK
jgi:hypothetical protein